MFHIIYIYGLLGNNCNWEIITIITHFVPVSTGLQMISCTQLTILSSAFEFPKVVFVMHDNDDISLHDIHVYIGIWDGHQTWMKINQMRLAMM